MQFSDYVIEVDSVDEVRNQKDRIREAVNTKQICVLRGLFESNTVLEDLSQLEKTFDKSNDIRRSGAIAVKMKNFQRLDCGDYLHHNSMNPRLYRLIARFFWNEDDSFSKFFYPLAKVRSIICDREGLEYDSQKCIDIDGTRYCEYNSVLQYPAGGGFSGVHCDRVDPAFPLGNLLMTVTQKGEQYKDGGVYYKIGGEFINFDDHLEPGDVYFHHHKMPHGVQSVDPYAPLNLDSCNGRVVLYLSTYDVN